MVLDVKRAFLHGDIQRPVYIRLPAEDPKSCVPGLLGKLRKAMYGTRDAPAVWQKVVKEAMLSVGFVCSLSNPSVFRHERRDILVVTHVDDFLCCAQRDDLDWLWKSLSKRYTLKSKVLGPNSGEFRDQISWEAPRLDRVRHYVRGRSQARSGHVGGKEYGIVQQSVIARGKR